MKAEKMTGFISGQDEKAILSKWVMGAFALGLLYWLLDAGIDYLFFYENRSLANLVMGPFPSVELYKRLLVLGLFLVFGNLYGRKEIRQQRTKSTLERINRAQHLLSTSNYYLIRLNDEQQLLEKICRLIVEDGKYGLAWIGYKNGEQLESIEPLVCISGKQRGAHLDLATETETELKGSAFKAYSGGNTIVKQFAGLPLAESGSDPEVSVSTLRSLVSLPLIVDEEPIGAITICSEDKDGFDQQEIKLLEELSDDVSFGIQTIRLAQNHEEGMKRLSENERKYRTLIQNIPDADVYLFDTDMRFMAAEGSEMKRYGRDSAYWVNKTLEEALEPETYRFLEPLYRKALNGGTAKEEFRYGDHYYMIQTAPILGEQGEVVGGMAFNQNITPRKYAEKVRQESEEKFKTIFNNANDAIFLHGINEDGEPGKFTEVNDVACNILGYSRKELLELTPLDVNTKDRKGNIVAELETKSTATFEEELVARDGTVILMEISSQLFYMGNKKRILSIARDIRDRKEMEATLKQEEELLQKLMNNMPDTIYFKNTASEFTRINKAQVKMLGINAPEEAIGTTDFDYFPAEHAWEAYNEEQKIFETGKPVINKVENVRRADGEHLWVMTTKVPLWDKQNRVTGLVGVTRNINRRKTAEENLQQALREKEVLLRELYHRTKNNMQVIQSMLQLQMMEEEDEYIREVFTETSNRINTMSLVHQKLYQSDNLSSIDLGEFFSELSELILSSYPEQGEHVQIDRHLESVDVTIDVAVPLGLVFNELITNIMKHAFPNGQEGNITIELGKEDSQIHLSVADDGIGFPAHELPDSSRSMGVGTIYSIVENQLHGSVEYDLEDGVRWSISIREQLYSKRV